MANIRDVLELIMNTKKNPRIVKMTQAHKQAVWAVRDGADVRSPQLARLLREVEATKPGYISIGDCEMGPYGVKDVLPYFGVIATARGKQWAHS